MTYIIAIIVLLPDIYEKIKIHEWIYIGILLIGLIFHSLVPEAQKYSINDSFKWIILSLLIISKRKYNFPSSFYKLLLIILLVHCSIGLYEYKFQKHIFAYTFVEEFDNFESSTQFRAFGLMQHPLYAANILLIIMSFLLVNRNIHNKLKIPFIILGTIALLCFNSRAAMMIWFCVLFYRLFLYKTNLVVTASIGIVLYFFLMSDLSSILLSKITFLGRLAEKGNLSDDSSLTRLASYSLFFNSRWNFQDIVYGGRIIYMPGSDLSLENGILLTISWWGWLIGPLKVILELTISYLCLEKYSIKEKFIILISCWGCAFANNNSFTPFVFAFFIVSYLSFDSVKGKRRFLQR